MTRVRFATPHVGYLYGPALLMTTDGGRAWQAQPGPRVEALAVADGEVYRVSYHHAGCPGPCHPALQEAKAGATSWRTLIAHLAYPDRSGQAQIVASGSDLLVALYGSQAGPVSAQAVVYRSADGGASWRRMADPCSGRGPGGAAVEEDLTRLAAARGGFVAGLCSPHVHPRTGAFVVASADGGASWRTAGALPNTPNAPNAGGLNLLAAASPAVLAVSTGATGGSGSVNARLLISSDGGRHWGAAADDAQQIPPGGVPAWLGFQTPQAGWWVSGPHSVWRTRDGGRRWSRAAFP